MEFLNAVIFGDCRDSMRKMKQSGVKVQTCVTSPPYYGLRDYGRAAQIGMEDTPEQFVASLVEVFRCVRDLLTDDGTLWLNLGDSYASARGGSVPPAETLAGGKNGWTEDGSRVNRNRKDGYNPTRDAPTIGLKHKDLIGIPWRVAFALQADGWYLRQDIIWHKPNPMPESVTDRCTKAHEYIFLLTKSERYYYDAEAINERVASSSVARLSQPTLAQQGGSDRVPGKTNGNMKAVGNVETRNRRSVWTVPTEPYKGAHFATFPPALIEPCILAGSRVGDVVIDPFMGSGTTAQVAQKLGRDWMGCELNEDYSCLQKDRTMQPALCF